MATHYPPGMDGVELERRTAAQLQHVLRDWLVAGDVTAAASGTADDDMVTIRMSGMHCRALMRHIADRMPYVDLGDGPIRREQ